MTGNINQDSHVC